jgi:hypothetical protein
MKISNVSRDIAFKSIYIVESTNSGQQDSIKGLASANVPKTETEVLFDLLNAGGRNSKTKLIRNGGAFKPEERSRCIADAIELNSPPLLLVDDEVSRPGERIDEFKRSVEAKWSKISEINDVGVLKSELTPQEIAQVIREMDAKAATGRPVIELVHFATAVQQKIGTEAALRFKSLYAELAAGDIIQLPKEVIGKVRQAIMDNVKLLAQCKK